MSSALAKANDVTDVKKLAPGTQAKALTEAMGQIDRLKKSAGKVKGNVGHTAMQLAYTGEIQGATFLASMGAGYNHARTGKVGLKVGPVPVRAGLGIILGAWGMYDALANGGGGHQLAVANGLIASETAELGMLAGGAMYDKMKAGGQAAAPAPAQIPANDMTVVTAAPAQGRIDGPIREVHANPARRELRLFRRQAA